MVKSALNPYSRGASNTSVDSSKSTATVKLRLLVSIMVVVTMGLFCQMCQVLCLSGNLTIAGALITFVAFFGYVWMSIHSNALTRARKAFFDETNVLETYQPRARTMGHLFCPEPPTPAPAQTVKFTEASEEDKGKHTAEENAAFNAMRDSHYANMFQYAMKMQKELQAMEKAKRDGDSGKSPTLNTESTQVDSATSQSSQAASSQKSSSSSGTASSDKKPKSSSDKEVFI